MILDIIGILVGITCWFLFLVLPLGIVLYLLLTTAEDEEEA